MTALWIILGILIFGITVFLVCIKPNHRREGFPFAGAMIAHRGLHGKDIPENSLAAFQAAVDAGNIGVELDVQLTHDQIPVVFHDGNLQRMCGVDRRITDATLAELTQYTLADTDQKIPRFVDVLETLKGIPLICEIKVNNGADYKALSEKAYSLLQNYPGPYCIESFHPGVLLWFKSKHPEVLRGQLAMNFFRDCDTKLPLYQKILLSHLMLNIFTQPDFIAYRFTDTNVPGFRLCRKLYHPHTAAWTPVGKKEIIAARIAGFDTLIYEEEQE